MTKALQDDRQQPFLWLHLEVTDLELDLAAKGLYLHIVRRTGKNGQCWESVENMAHHCCTSTGTVKRLLKKLLTYNLIKRTSRSGMTTVYSLTDVTEWTCPKVKPFNRDRSEATQVEFEPGQNQPRSDLIYPPGSNSTHPPGSNSTHKTDPNETDPNETDPNFLNAHTHEAEILKSVEPESEPLPSNPGRDAIPVKAILVEPKAIGEDTFSAAAPESEIFENWQAFYRKHNRPPWRFESGDFHPLMIRAYHATGGSPGRLNIHDLPNGKPNIPKIKAILRRKDNSALGSGYSLKDPTTCELQDLWQLAQDLDRQPPVVMTQANHQAMQTRLAIYNAIKDL